MPEEQFTKTKKKKNPEIESFTSFVKEKLRGHVLMTMYKRNQLQTFGETALEILVLPVHLF